MSDPWNEIDSTLNKAGEWLLVGVITCATLPPIVGVLSCAILLIVSASKSDQKVGKWERNLLNIKIDSDTATKQEEKTYMKLNDRLERSKSHRRIANFMTGYWFIWLVVVYLIIKQYLICNDKLIILPEWLIKGSFGSL